MIISIMGFFGARALPSTDLVMGWQVVPFADLLARFRDDFDLALDRVPSGRCAGGLSGFKSRQDKYH